MMSSKTNEWKKSTKPTQKGKGKKNTPKTGKTTESTASNVVANPGPSAITLSGIETGNVSFVEDVIRFLVALARHVKEDELIESFHLKDRSQVEKREKLMEMIFQKLFVAYFSFRPATLTEGLVINFQTYKKCFAQVRGKRIFLWEVIYAFERLFEKPLSEVIFTMTKTLKEVTKTVKVFVDISCVDRNFTLKFTEVEVKMKTMEEQFPALSSVKKTKQTVLSPEIKAAADEFDDLPVESLEEMLQKEAARLATIQAEIAKREESRKAAQREQWAKERANAQTREEAELAKQAAIRAKKAEEERKKLALKLVQMREQANLLEQNLTEKVVDTISSGLTVSDKGKEPEVDSKSTSWALLADQ